MPYTKSVILALALTLVPFSDLGSENQTVTVQRSVNIPDVGTLTVGDHLTFTPDAERLASLYRLYFRYVKKMCTVYVPDEDWCFPPFPAR